MNRFLYLSNLAGRTYQAPAGDDGSIDGSGGSGGENPGSESGGDADGDGDGESDDGDGDTGENPDVDKNKDGDPDKNKDADKSSSLSDSEAKLLKDVMKSKKRAEQAEAKVLELTGVMGDATPEEVAELIKLKKDADRTNLEKKGEYDRIVSSMAEENQKTLDAKDLIIQGHETQVSTLQAQITELTIGRAFSDSEFVTNDIALPKQIARKEFGDHFELDGVTIIGYDKPRGSSDRTPLVDGQGKNLSFEEAITKLVGAHADSASLIKSKAKPGANSHSSEKTRGKVTEAPVTGLGKIQRALSDK